MGEPRPSRSTWASWIAASIAVAGMLYVGLAGWGWLAVVLVPASVAAVTMAVNTVWVLVAEKKERGEEDDD